jgi:photosystem II stability/assembly factor-like uncharacterized protein
MKPQKTPKVSLLSWAIRIGLFILTLGIGTVATLLVGEMEGLARADLSHAPVRTMTAATDGQALYATVSNDSQDGIYRSDDNGRTWQFANFGPGVALNALAVHPTNKSVLYAGAPGGQVAKTNNLWRSDDGGQTWRPFFLSLPSQVDGLIPAVTSLVVDPNQPQALYVGTDGQGVYRFDVGSDGQGYELVGGVSLYDAHVTKLVVGPDSRVYALTANGLFSSIDDDDWQKLESFPEYPVSLAVAPTDPETLYAGSSSSGAWRSTDGGETWEQISDGLGLVPGASLRVTALAVDEADSWHVAAATAYGIGKQLAGGGIYESEDGGRSWTQLAEIEDLVTDLTFNDGVIHAVTPKGLARYGEPIKSSPAASSGLQALADLSGAQILILALTTGLAGLVLVAQKDWFKQ